MVYKAKTNLIAYGKAYKKGDVVEDTRIPLQFLETAEEGREIDEPVVEETVEETVEPVVVKKKAKARSKKTS